MHQTRAQSKLQLTTQFKTILITLQCALNRSSSRAHVAIIVGLLGLSVTKPGQVEQKQVHNLDVLEVHKDLREHLHERLDP